MKVYEGRWEGCAAVVTVNGHALDPRLDLWNHSPTGFEWGYVGSGPAQLALALVAYHLGDDQQALNLYQRFKWAVVTQLPLKRWRLTSEQIAQSLRELGVTETVAVAARRGARVGK